MEKELLNGTYLIINNIKQVFINSSLPIFIVI